ncbi:MAG: glycosyltransferase family 4 protein [Verrucomicrobiota bacterium JB023]|nr:glycosyltransferase family 4 protein [Verrucomicrobiota bacterium JB023]
MSQANPTDLVQDPRMHGFRDFLLTSGIPYLTLFQLVPEFLDLSNHRRKCLAEILHKAKENLFVSQRNEEVIRKTLLFDGSGSVVDNPIGFSPPKKVLDWPSEDEGLHFAIVGRLSCPHKGHDILMEALGSPAWRERKWTLNLYGDGADEEYLKTMATFYGLDARCLFHGHVSKAEEIWEKCHVCLLPSRMEGTPIVLLESMAAGRPAVVTDVGGNADCVKEGESGFVVPAPTVQLLLDGLEKLWDNQQRLESLGESAFGRFCQLRGLDRSTSHVLSLMTSQLR